MTFGIFKTATYNWQKNFDVPNLLSLQMFVMRLNGEWRIDFGKYLPKQLSFLSKPLIILYCAFWSFMALHISIFFFVAFVIRLKNDSPIPDMSSVFTQGVVFGFAFYTTVHFQWNHNRLEELFNFVFVNFKMRSARGLFTNFPFN